MCLSIDEEQTTEQETVVDAGPTRTLADLTGFAKRVLEGTALDPEEAVAPTEAEPDAGIGGVFAQASANLLTEMLLGHGDHLAQALQDVFYGLAGIAVEYKLDLEQIVDGTVREYERREEASRAQQAFMDEFLAELRQLSAEPEGDQGTLEL